MNIAVIIGAFHKKEMDIMLEEVQKICTNRGMNIQSEVWVP